MKASSRENVRFERIDNEHIRIVTERAGKTYITIARVAPPSKEYRREVSKSADSAA